MSQTEQIPLSHDHTMVSGDTWGEEFDLTDNGTPINLTGYTVRALITAKAGDTTALLEASTTDASVGIGGAGSNKITINKLMSLPAGSYVRSVKLVSSGGYTRTYIRGAFFVI